MNEANLNKFLARKKYKRMRIQKLFDMFLIIILGTLQIIDFVFTWYGIHELNIIAEANPFLIWTFEIPFKKAIILRMAFISVIIIALAIIRNNSRKSWLVVNILGIICNIVIAYMHYLWILPYL